MNDVRVGRDELEGKGQIDASDFITYIRSSARDFS